ncbi:MAG: hypothetical protein FD153_1926 [Rhodospirillaceae bacterium]|nr:MAG: hypothetical protein FD153_1926 [Rhodospirillaceae bacterium]
MIKRARLFVLLGIGLLFGLSSASWAQAKSSKLLGLPFGVPTTLEDCPILYTEAKAPCWRGPMQKNPQNGDMGGPVYLPNSETLPEWVDGAEVRASMNASGVIFAIQVIVDHSNRKEISRSIGARYGKPVISSPLSQGGHLMEWRSSEGKVTMMCWTGCTVMFLTAAAARESDAEMARMEARRKARPVAP